MPPLSPEDANPAPGDVEAGFLVAISRFAGPVRGIGLALISAFGLLSVPDDALPVGLALVGLVLVGAVADVVTSATGRGARVTFALAVLRAGVVCATQAWTVPAAGPNLWALNVLTITAITVQWEWPPTWTVPVTAGLLAVFVLSGGAPFTVLRVLVECLLARLAFHLLLRSTRGVDELRARQAALERAEVLARERRRREREYLALLHDTASATFLMVALRGRTADPAEVAEHARRDLDVLRDAPGLDDRLVDVESSLRAVAERSPLAVDAHWERVPLLPVPVTLALVRAVQEAMANVARHAGVREAGLRVAADGEGVVVTVVDTGHGFEPGDVPGHRRGIRGSVVERMAAVGGSATVTSRPGDGTTVRLAWPRG
ncbi:sensor histidine kinase [Umezawaea tangerina]|uniref:Signal transduction histidine kinase n=1 Tax=Umezawaea tangerina TaxID=84725 RepID=A0A2T0T806_9PSEU|nr:ATP-binding protein [Umezawaea tangerina]PRY41770.1 signal transduction histidine kinase [Umezawaea tangerina]